MVVGADQSFYDQYPKAADPRIQACRTSCGRRHPKPLMAPVKWLGHSYLIVIVNPQKMSGGS